MKEYIIEAYMESDTGSAAMGRTVAELIRCKDCKYRITANCERFGIKRYTQSDSFCSWAERKETS